MPFLNNQNQLRTVEWGRKYLWDVKFLNEGLDNSTGSYQKIPSDFRDWFPAVDLEENLANVVTDEFSGPTSTYRIPKGGSATELTITFVDNSDNALLKWLEDWVNIDVLGRDKTQRPKGGVGTLQEVVRKVQVLKLSPEDSSLLDRARLLVSSKIPTNLFPIDFGQSRLFQSGRRGTALPAFGGIKTYSVFPDGAVTYSGSSTSEVPIYIQKFNIVETQDGAEANNSVKPLSVKSVTESVKRQLGFPKRLF